MKISRIFAATAILLTSMSGCSSAPPPTDEVYDTRNRAAEYAEFGHRYFEAARYDKALEFYKLSLANNIAVDNMEGIAKSRNSLGKLYMVTGQQNLAAVVLLKALEIAQEL